MQATGNNSNKLQARLTIRVSNNTLSFSAVDREAEHQLVYEPYAVKTGVSMAANLRQAFKESPLLQRGYQKVRVYIDAPLLVVPVEEFREDEIETLYTHTFTGHDNDAILYRVQPALNVVAVFPVNKDFKLVIEDNFSDIRFTPIMQPMWNYFHQRNFTSIYRKLYGYFHENKLEVFCFTNNRLKFHNSFATTHAKDAIYFLLYVWKHLELDQQKDELHIIGDVPDRDWFMHNIKFYIQKPYLLKPSAEFNRASITEIAGMPFDLTALYLSK